MGGNILAFIQTEKLIMAPQPHQTADDLRDCRGEPVINRFHHPGLQSMVPDAIWSQFDLKWAIPLS